MSASHEEEPAPFEQVLRKHYSAFASFLNVSDDIVLPPPSPRQAKSRERLHRMPRVPFVELSTDIHDELQRRIKEADSTNTGMKVPSSLEPKSEFHPKRNQTREHLSVLQQPRFRDLVLDVFFEVVRRVPITPLYSHGSYSSTNLQSKLPQIQYHSHSSSNVSNNEQTHRATGSSSSISTNNSNNIGRPLPRTFQATTVVPSKSVMVEKSDDDEEEEEEEEKEEEKEEEGVRKGNEEADENFDKQTVSFEPNSNESVNNASNFNYRYKGESSFGNRSSPVNRSSVEQLQTANDQEIIELTDELKTTRANLEKEVTANSGLQTLVDDLRANIQLKDNELSELHGIIELERASMAKIQNDFNTITAANKKLSFQVNLLETEVDRLKAMSPPPRSPSHATPVIIQPSSPNFERHREYEDLLAEHERLKLKLQEQHQVTEQVRVEALKFISEMRTLASFESTNREKANQMMNRISVLETENRRLREQIDAPELSIEHDRTYTKTKLPLDSPYISESGMIALSDFQNFHSIVDDVLRIAPVVSETKIESLFMESVRSLITCVKNILAEADGLDTGMTGSQSSTKVLSRVSVTTNNLVLAAKNHVLSAGIAPVSVFEAAVASTVNSVVDLVKVAKLRNTSLL
ncbi:hypothetical protein V1511DRAFT_456970 [Dipodascopsis uninucleata]